MDSRRLLPVSVISYKQGHIGTSRVHLSPCSLHKSSNPGSITASCEQSSNPGLSQSGLYNPGWGRSHWR